VREDPGFLPTDGHVHSEWSWDTTHGSMEETCARAVELGLPAVAFTEHADFGGWAVLIDDLNAHPHLKQFAPDRGDEGDVVRTLQPPPLDVQGYLACVERCRELFPDLRIVTGVELGEPHRHSAAVTRLLQTGRFERILGSIHSLADGNGVSEMSNLFRQRRPEDVVRDYLAEVLGMIEGSDVFSVLAHIDYAVRYWPEAAQPFDALTFEAEFRAVLQALAQSGRTLEVNTRGRLPTEILRWWHEEGGETVTFGSDAHNPAALAQRFAEAISMVESVGFVRADHDLWERSTSRA
jgi:histidinol-phosphatase (PHP family)